jgi:hypothetical protein
MEGTQTTPGELLAAEAGAIVDRSPEDLGEVGNDVVALEHGISRGTGSTLQIRKKSIERLLTRKVVNGTVSSCSTSKLSMIRQRRQWLWSPCGVDSSPS